MSQNNKATGKIINILPVKSGESKDKRIWRKKEFVIQLSDGYSNIICFSIWNKDIEKFQIELNENVEVSFDAISRENNGKYYSELKAWNITKHGNKTRTFPISSVPEIIPEPIIEIPTYNKNESFDDLPF